MPNSTRVDLTTEGAVATIRFSSAKGVSVFSSRVLGEVGEYVGRLAEDPRTRFVVFRGEGKTFVAGADIEEMSRFDEPQGRAFAEHGHSVFRAIENLPQVTIAAINGHALGGGCELALACDFRLIAAGAKIGQPEVHLGLIPGWGGTLRLPKLIGPAAARRLLYSGEAVTADEARRIGLVDEVVASAEGLDEAIARWIGMFAKASPKAITRVKRSLASQDEVRQFACCFSCSDAEEGIQAFLAKRPANWTQ